ncbi:MAG: hypothetical protein V3T86_07410 [Planctomycetota bacterium]
MSIPPGGFIEFVIPDRTERIKCAERAAADLDMEMVTFIRLADKVRAKYEGEGVHRDVLEFAYGQLKRLAHVQLDVLVKSVWRWAFERSARIPWTYWTAPTVLLFDEFGAALAYELTGIVPEGFRDEQ